MWQFLARSYKYKWPIQNDFRKVQITFAGYCFEFNSFVVNNAAAKRYFTSDSNVFFVRNKQIISATMARKRNCYARKLIRLKQRSICRKKCSTWFHEGRKNLWWKNILVWGSPVVPTIMGTRWSSVLPWSGWHIVMYLFYNCFNF